MEILPDARVLKDVMVPLRDGVQLAVDIFLPHQEGAYPALLAMSPYGKNNQRQLLPQPLPGPLTDACIEAGWTDDIVGRGYAHVVACTRGTGQSEGAFYSMYSEQESQDGYDLVEWIAAQDWCDDQVGMLGISYFGTVQLVVAAAAPPHLKAIAPTEATTDQYLACYHGGVLDGFYSELTTGRHSSLGWSGFQGTNLNSWSKKEWGEEKWREKVAESKADPDINQYNLIYSNLDCAEKNTVFHDVTLNPFDEGGYWWNPDLAKIEIPVLCGCAWYPDCGPKFVRGPFMIWDGVKGPKKMVMWPGGWLERPFHQYHEKILAWFDYWLKDIDNGIMDEPPIELFIQGENHYRFEEEWPLARTVWTDYYLKTHGRLSTAPERYPDIPPDAYAQAPIFVTSSITNLRYSTGRLPGRLEVTGPITLYVYVAIDAEDSWLKATLFDISPGGESRELTHGHLKLSRRELDPERSKHYQPIHKHTAASVAPVTPGEIYEYAIELYPLSNVFLAGHELVVELCSGDLPGERFSYHVMPSKTISYKIYRDAAYQSRLHLPIIPNP